MAGVGGSCLFRVGVVKVGQRPATVGGKPADRIPALGDDLPQLFGGFDPAGVPASHTHDHDRILSN